jgi:hypothetical protein
MALVSGLKVCLGDASVYRLRGVKWLCSQAFKCNCVQSFFSHFTAYSCVVC